MLSIVVPYRRRRKNLEGLIASLDFALRDFEWELVVAELADGKPFNHGLLDNIGFLHSKGESVCFHDVDMIPVSADYSPPTEPVCLLSSCNLFNNSIPYERFFGGVTLFRREDYLRVNGYSNRYLGWGASDDDMWIRCERAGFKPGRREGVFFHQPHSRELCRADLTDNPNRLDLFARTDPSIQWSDGLNSIQYECIDEHRAGNKLFLAVDYDPGKFQAAAGCSTKIGAQ